MAERSGLAGKYVGSIERGERDPGLFVMHVLARTFGIPLGELLGACVKLSPKAIEMGHEFDACDEVIQDAVLQLLRAAHLTNKRSKPRK